MENMKMTIGQQVIASVAPLPIAVASPVSDNATGRLVAVKQSSQYRLPPKELQSETDLNEEQLSMLKAQGFPSGLAKTLAVVKDSFPLRIWVIDNSGSMQKNDGQSIVKTRSNHDVKMVPSTRWSELQGCIEYHSQLVALLKSPTSFRMLNNPGSSAGQQQFGIAETGDEPWQIQQDLQNVHKTMAKARPLGTTPLTEHILEIQGSIREMLPELQNTGKRVAIVLATDGLPTNAQGYGGDVEATRFISALRTLEGLPVWVVVRLCTDDDEVVDFYNGLDEQLELSVEVLDDFLSEAKEVRKHNRWLNYALPLHRCREMGFHDRLFDLIDERPLTKGELRDFCLFLFGEENFDGMADPVADWATFKQEIDRLQRCESQQWNPAKRRPTSWIDMKALEKAYGDGIWKRLTVCLV